MQCVWLHGVCVVWLLREGFRRRVTCGRSEWLCGRCWRARRAGRTTGSATIICSERCGTGTPRTCPGIRRRRPAPPLPRPPPPPLPLTVRESWTTWWVCVGAATRQSGRLSPTSTSSSRSRVLGSVRHRLQDTAGHIDGVIASCAQGRNQNFISGRGACFLPPSIPFLFSERELKFRFAICRRPSVCRLSVCRLSSVVCNVRAPYSGDWNFRKCFYAIWYLGHPWPLCKNFTEIVPGEPLHLGLNARGVAKYSDFGPIGRYISETVQDRC